MRNLGPLVVASLVFLLVLGAGTVAGQVTKPAPDPVVVEVQLYDFAIAPHGLELRAGEQAALLLVNTGAVEHNLWVDQGGAVAQFPGTLQGGESGWLNFTVPSEGVITYFCNVPGHLELGMTGRLIVQGAAIGGEEGRSIVGVHDIVSLGVNYFAYWVGVISFVVLFVVIAATYFLLRYGETAHWTDWKDRPQKGKKDEAPPKVPVGTWAVLGIVLLVFLVAAMQILRLV